MFDKEKMKKIVSCIRRSKNGITISKIAEKTGLHRQTVSKYVLALYYKRMVKINEVGKAKLIIATKRIDEWKKLVGD